MMTARILPAIDRDNEAFWTWGGEGRLAIHRCADCRYYVHPPVPFCPQCEGRDVAAQAVSGRGRIVSFTVNHKARSEEHKSELQSIMRNSYAVFRSQKKKIPHN